MLTKQQQSIARDLYRASLRIERVTNGNTTVYDHDLHAAWFRRVQDECEAAQVPYDSCPEFFSLAGATMDGANR